MPRPSQSVGSGDKTSITHDRTPELGDLKVQWLSIFILFNCLQTLGEVKLSSMTECMDFKKGIHVHDW